MRNVRKIHIAQFLVEKGGHIITQINQVQTLKMCSVAPAGMVMRSLETMAETPKSKMKAGTTVAVIQVGFTMLKREIS